MQIKSHKSVEQIAKKHRMNVSDIQKQLDMGVPIEHEHTRDKVLATDIALQHLDEIPDYYTRLKKMEASAKKEHRKFKDVKEDAVTDLQRGLTELEDASYDSVDSLMRRIMKKRNVTAKKLHDDFVNKHNQTPDTWIKRNQKKLNSVSEATKSGDQGLHDWFGKSKSKDGKKGWVQLGGEFSGKPCARQSGQTSTPKCGSSKMKKDLTKDEEDKAFERKNRLDANQPEKTAGSKPTNVRTEEMNLQEVKDKAGKNSGKKDACYNKVKSRYDVWPSAYASGALVKCRKVGVANWGTKSEACWDGYEAKGMKKKGKKMVPNCVPVNSESTDSLDYTWNTPIRERADRYCPKCEKLETRSECKYGTKYWDMFSLPAELISSKKDYNITMPHPANEEKDHEYSMARSEISTIIGAAKRLKKKMGKGEGNLEAWVQSKITKAADYLDAAADYVDSGEMKKESVSIEDANGNHYVQFIDIIKPQSLKPSRGIGSEILGEGPSFEVGGRKSTGMGAMTPQDVEKLKQGNPGASSKIDDKYQQIRRGINLPLAKKEDKKEVQVSHYNMKTFGRFMTEAKKSEMKCNSPKSEPVGDSLTGKSHVVKACENGKEKLLRFGQRGVKGSPKKEGESKDYASRRHRFQTRHAKNISKGKMSAAFWSNKVKW
jgi:hypothetical protein